MWLVGEKKGGEGGKTLKPPFLGACVARFLAIFAFYGVLYILFQITPVMLNIL